MYTAGTAYILCIVGFCGPCGLHRFYVGKPISGLIWLFTFGLLGFGQLLDLLLIPGMVAQANLMSGFGGSRNVNNINVTVVNSQRGRRGDYDDDDYDDRPRRRRR